MRLLHLLSLLACTVARPGAASADESDDPHITGFPGFLEWYRSNGGTIDERVTIGYEPGTKIRGMIATAAIPANTVLIHTPEPIVLSIVEGNSPCQTIEEIISEMKLGSQSKWHIYFEYDDSSSSRVPSQWDKSNGPGRAMNELQGMPPAGDTHRHVDWYQSACIQGGEMTDDDMEGLKIYLTRSSDIGLVPMYDLMNHHNGKINTRLERDGAGGLLVYALDDIQADEPIYNTYARAGFESTVDVFNTYGFVEDYPQLWRWNDEELVRISGENEDHAFERYGMVDAEGNEKPADRMQYEPNSIHHEVLVLSPTLAALSPTKDLVEPLGNKPYSMEHWEEVITAHHAFLRASHAGVLQDSASKILKELPTTIEEDEKLLPDERRRLKKVEKVGRIDVNKADAIDAIEFRLAFKKALKLTVDVAESETFLEDWGEL